MLSSSRFFLRDDSEMGLAGSRDASLEMAADTHADTSNIVHVVKWLEEVGVLVGRVRCR